MAQGGSIKVRLERVEADLETEIARWKEAGLPNVGDAYRFNNNEFMHHVHTLAHTKILKDYLGLTDDQIELAMKEVFLSELISFYDVIIETRRQQLIARIVPPGMNDHGGN